MAPTLTAALQAPQRVLLTLTWPGIQTATIQRLDPDGVLRNVRTNNADDSLVCLGSAVVFDHECPLDQAVTYQATSPQGAGTVVSDLFGRTVSNGFGNADTGQAYSTSGGSASDYSVSGGTGRISNGTRNVVRFVSVDAGQTDVTVTVDCQFGVGTPTGGLIDFDIYARLTGTNNGYFAELEAETTGVVTLRLWRQLSGGFTALSALTNVGNNNLNDVWRVTVTATGTTLSATAQNITTPAGPVTLTASDSSITTGTRVGWLSFLSSGNTNTLPVVSQFDNLSVTSPAPLTVISGAVVSPSNGQAWLTHPGHPQYAGIANVTSDGVAETRPARRGVFSPIGTSLPVVVNDVRSGSTGTLVVQTNTATDITRLRNMLADGFPLLLRQPLTWGGDSWWISIADVNIDRFTKVATDNWRRWTLPFQRVDRPSGASDGAIGQTWNDVKATYATWNALAATGKTWTALAQSVT